MNNYKKQNVHLGVWIMCSPVNQCHPKNTDDPNYRNYYYFYKVKFL